MYELHVRVEDDALVIEPRGPLDAAAHAHLRECIAAAQETGLPARVEPRGERLPVC